MNTSWQQHLLPEIHTLKSKRVIVRVDWNMPIKDGEIIDTSRFDVSIPFLKELSFAGAKIVILTHFGEKGESLGIIASHVTKTLPFISFTQSLDFDEIKKSAESLEEGDALLLENVRMWKGETDNVPSLSESFASLGNIFINDAFSVSHREHSSVVGIAKRMLSYFGPLCARELENLSKAITPVKPAILIVGGAKISTKLLLIQHYLDQGVTVFLGGAMAHNIWKGRGLEIGKSFYDSNLKISDTILNHPLILTPSDVILESGEIVDYNNIPADGMVVDCGDQTVEMLGEKISSSKTIIANGPLGLYERGWRKGSEEVLAKIANSEVTSYIGGGDTVAIAHSLHLLQNFTFVSLGGGAMLEFLSAGTLVGIESITNQSK